MHSHPTTVLATAALLALSTSGAHAQPKQAKASDAQEVRALKATVEDLRKQLQDLKESQRNDAQALEKAHVEELRKQLDELRAQLNKQQQDKQQQESKAAEAVAAGENESQEAIDARTPATKADVQGLRTDLENYKYDQSRLQERNIPSVTRNTKIGGSITVGYATQNPAFVAGDKTTTPAEPRKNGFTIGAAQLNFTGTLFRDYEAGRNLTYRLALQAAQNLDKNSTSTDFGKNNPDGTQINITDAYIRYSYEPQSGDPQDRLGTITLGQQVIPFGQEPQALDPEVRPVINNAQFVTGLDLNNRQIGLVVAGDYDPYVDYTNNYRAPLLAYGFGLINGNGPNKPDNNSLRDVIGRLVYTLPVDYSNWLRQLQIGVSHLHGYTEVGTTTATAGRKGAYNRSGFDVNWTHLPFSISYEWAYGKKEVLVDATHPDGFQRGVGQYINLGYTWGEQFLNSSKQQGKFDDYWPKSYQAFLRFDSFDPDHNALVTNDHKYITTLGLNFFFAETTKFQINYLHSHLQLGSTAPTAAKPRSSNGIQAQFNATF